MRRSVQSVGGCSTQRRLARVKLRNRWRAEVQLAPVELNGALSRANRVARVKQRKR